MAVTVIERMALARAPSAAPRILDPGYWLLDSGYLMGLLGMTYRFTGRSCGVRKPLKGRIEPSRLLAPVCEPEPVPDSCRCEAILCRGNGFVHTAMQLSGTHAGTGSGTLQKRRNGGA